MLTQLIAKVKDRATAVDLASFYAAPAGSMIGHLGFVVWGLWLIRSSTAGSGLPWWGTILAMASIWVAVPLGLRLADQPGAGPITSAVGVIRLVVIPAAVFTSLAVTGSPGVFSALLTVPWLLFALWVAGIGLTRFLSRPSTTANSLARDISLLALAPSAVLLAVARLGVAPFGLSVGPLTVLACVGMSMAYFLPVAANHRPQSGPAIEWEPVVVHLGRRTLVDLFRLRNRAIELAPTVQPGLASRELPPGYRVDAWSLPVDDFDNSCEALWNWAGHSEAGLFLNPAQPPISLGETFAMAIPLGPLSVTGTCRIIGVIDEPEVYGFGYSTLGHHAWSAEQSIVITNIGGEPTVTATVVWAPTIVGSKLIPRLTKHLIGQHINGILKGIAEAEVAELHHRMQSIVKLVPIPREYRVPVVVEETEVVVERPKPKTGAELLNAYENSWF